MSDFHVPSFKILEINDVEALSQTIPWSLSDLAIPQAWKSSEGEGITIALLDTGMAHHDDLNINIDSTSVSLIKNEPSPYDFNGHGTASSGIVVCENNNYGIVGVAPKAKILSLKVLNRSGGGSNIIIEKALEYIWKNREKIDIVNMSLGSRNPLSSNGTYLIKKITDFGIPIIAAAGNKPKDGVLYPAKYPEVFAIGAYGFSTERHLADFSAMGPEIDFAAPGMNITTTWLNNQYAVLQGTSFACPFFSGIIALLLSKNKKENKKLTVQQIKDILIKNSIDVGEPGRDDKFGYGIINIKSLFCDFSDPEHPIVRKKTWWEKVKEKFKFKA
jgi:subtilisin family serine protease